MKKNICIVTGSRAEYGLLRNLIKEIDKSKVVNYQLICTGTHLLRKAGNTVNEILDDGFKIDASVKILSNSSLASDIETCKATSNCLNKISKEFKKLNPNIIVLLGDRFEILASAIAATICGLFLFLSRSSSNLSLSKPSTVIGSLFILFPFSLRG